MHNQQLEAIIRKVVAEELAPVIELLKARKPAPHKATDELLPARQVADRLGCSMQTVYDMIDDGRLVGTDLREQPKGKRGKKGRRVSASSLDAFLESRVKPKAKPESLPVAVPVVLPKPSPVKRAPGSRVVLSFPGRTRPAIPAS